MRTFPNPFRRPHGTDPHVIHEVEARLKELSVWRAEDVVPVTDEAREQCLHVLAEIITHEDRTPAVVPGFDGSVALEWNRYGREFEILVGPDAVVQTYFVDASAGVEWEKPFNEVEGSAQGIIATFR